MISKTKDVNKIKNTTLIVNTDLEDYIVQKVQKVLGTGNISKTSNSASKADITIIIGEDFNK